MNKKKSCLNCDNPNRGDNTSTCFHCCIYANWIPLKDTTGRESRQVEMKEEDKNCGNCKHELLRNDDPPCRTCEGIWGSLNEWTPKNWESQQIEPVTERDGLHHSGDVNQMVQQKKMELLNSIYKSKDGATWNETSEMLNELIVVCRDFRHTEPSLRVCRTCRNYAEQTENCLECDFDLSNWMPIDRSGEPSKTNVKL